MNTRIWKGGELQAHLEFLCWKKGGRCSLTPGARRESDEPQTSALAAWITFHKMETEQPG